MEDQQRLNNLLNEINAYRQQAELIQQQIDLIQTSIAEVDALSNTLDDLEGKDSVEAFVPVGAGSFIKGELKSNLPLKKMQMALVKYLPDRKKI